MRAGEFFELLACAGVGKGVAVAHEFGHRVAVARQVVGLSDGALVPVHAQPGEEINGQVEDTGLDAWSVQVLYSQDDAHALLAGPGPGDEEGAGVSEVERAGGAGGEARGGGRRGS